MSIIASLKKIYLAVKRFIKSRGVQLTATTVFLLGLESYNILEPVIPIININVFDLFIPIMITIQLLQFTIGLLIDAGNKVWNQQVYYNTLRADVKSGRADYRQLLDSQPSKKKKEQKLIEVVER